MNVSPAEGPEHRTDTLSPVSPKPVHFPAPSNIALLEHQMDPNFDGRSTDQKQDPSSLTNGNTQSNPFKIDGASDAKNGEHAAGEVTGGKELQNNTQNFLMNADLNASSSSHTQPASVLDFQPPPEQTDLPSPADQPSLPASQPMPTESSKVESLPNGPNLDPSGQASFPDAGLFASNHVSTTVAGGIDIQALLDNIAAPSKMSTAPSTSSLIATASQPADSLASHPLTHSESFNEPGGDDESVAATSNIASLPARPPFQPSPNNASTAQTLTHTPAELQSNPSAASNTSFAPLAHAAPPPLPTAGAPGVQTTTSIQLPPPPLPSFQQSQAFVPGLQTSGYVSMPPLKTDTPTIKTGQEESLIGRFGDGPTRGVGGEESLPWGQEIQKWYDDFLEAERRYVLEGNWEKFPIGSRLFLGNLPSERVTKRDLFHVFHRYGKLAQISIKQAYGFVQYLDAGDCGRAMKAEQGVSIRGKAISTEFQSQVMWVRLLTHRADLEISVPGGKKRHQQNEGRSSRNRRSRSPAGSRSAGRNSRSDNRHRARSPDRKRSRLDQHYPKQSHSPQQVFAQPQSGIPGNDSSLPLPHRLPAQVPDVQVIAKDQMESNIVQYIETSFAQRGLRADCLYLGALNEGLVVRRQMIEGVLAIMKVDRASQSAHRFQLTIFDRSQGGGNVKFEEYQQQELSIVIELVRRAKQNVRLMYPGQQAPAPLPTPQQHAPYQYSNLQHQPLAAVPEPAPAQPTQAAVPQAIATQNPDNRSLQDILDSLNKQPQSASTTAPPVMPAALNLSLPTPQQSGQSSPPDLAKILEAVQRSPTGQGGGQGASLSQGLQALSQGQQSSETPHAPDMSHILSQLSQYGRK
ncbi:MAG: hypothetical protein Q9162_003799 [Coniocarpon cinnabarinum]